MTPWQNVGDTRKIIFKNYGKGYSRAIGCAQDEDEVGGHRGGGYTAE